MDHKTTILDDGFVTVGGNVYLAFMIFNALRDVFERILKTWRFATVRLDALRAPYPLR